MPKQTQHQLPAGKARIKCSLWRTRCLLLRLMGLCLIPSHSSLRIPIFLSTSSPHLPPSPAAAHSPLLPCSHRFYQPHHGAVTRCFPFLCSSQPASVLQLLSPCGGSGGDTCGGVTYGGDTCGTVTCGGDTCAVFSLPCWQLWGRALQGIPAALQSTGACTGCSAACSELQRACTDTTIHHTVPGKVIFLVKSSQWDKIFL